MPRLRRKTPHEPVRAIPSPTEKRPAASLAQLEANVPTGIRAIAIALNAGTPRPKNIEEFPLFDDVVPAAMLAPFRERVASRDGRAELLVFRVGSELFATELRAVEEAVEGVAARLIPDAPPAMLGIFALRERTLPLYQLGRVLSLEMSGSPEMTLVIRPSGTRIALAVDQVDDVFDAALSAVRAAPTPDADGMVLGVVWRGSELVTLLDADVVVAHCLAAAAPPDSL
jgi:purine-binding chemotaxis protein CheW